MEPATNKIIELETTKRLCEQKKYSIRLSNKITKQNDIFDFNTKFAHSKRVFILGPCHHVRLSTCALSTFGHLETPLYDLTVDTQREWQMRRDSFPVFTNASCCSQ